LTALLPRKPSVLPRLATAACVPLSSAAFIPELASWFEIFSSCAHDVAGANARTIASRNLDMTPPLSDAGAMCLAIGMVRRTNERPDRRVAKAERICFALEHRERVRVDVALDRQMVR